MTDQTDNTPARSAWAERLAGMLAPDSAFMGDVRRLEEAAQAVADAIHNVADDAEADGAALADGEAQAIRDAASRVAAVRDGEPDLVDELAAVVGSATTNAETAPPLTWDRLDPFARAYVECALWSSTDADGTPLDDGRDASDVHPETLARMAEDCAQFVEAHGHLWADGSTQRGEWDIDEQAGHDLWLTRNHHGAGFWDRPAHMYTPENQDTLTAAAHALGEVELYVGDDAMVHAL